MKRYDVPRILFINKLDRMGADPWMAIEAARDRLSLNAAAVQVNIGIENGLEGVVDLVKWKAVYFDGDNGEIIREEEIPADLLEMCREKKLDLLSCLAECGDEKMEEYYLDENIEVPEEELKSTIRKHTLSLDFCPVFLGSAYKNKGVQKMMDGVIDYLPKPTEIANHAYNVDKDGEKTPMIIDHKKPFVGLAFKLEETKFG
jgi:elongation factor G